MVTPGSTEATEVGPHHGLTPPPLSRAASWDHMAYLGLVASSATGGSVSKRVGPGRGGGGQWRSGEGREKGTVGIQGWEGRGKAGKETDANGGEEAGRDEEGHG